MSGLCGRAGRLGGLSLFIMFEPPSYEDRKTNESHKYVRLTAPFTNLLGATLRHLDVYRALKQCVPIDCIVALAENFFRIVEQ